MKAMGWFLGIVGGIVMLPAIILFGSFYVIDVAQSHRNTRAAELAEMEVTHYPALGVTLIRPKGAHRPGPKIQYCDKPIWVRITEGCREKKS